MKLYHKLSQISFLKKSYAFKFLFVAFIGIHIPLIGILFFVLYGSNSIDPTAILIFSLVMTLLATGITLLVLKWLILPISLASKVLDEYRENRVLPDLPTQYKDEAGLLMLNIQESIFEMESFIKEKQDLIYMLSHDLKNFAGNPQGLAKLIIEETDSESVQQMAELICQSTDLQFKYIDNFIKLLKEQDDFLQIVPENQLLNFKEIVNTATEQVEKSLEEKKIKMISDIQVEETFLKIEKGFLTQVLVNLIVNAIKFSYEDSTVELHIFRENSKLFITVTDKGIGFDEEHKEGIFNKFTKISKLGTANETSTGLGLYLCKKIIEKHGGKLFANSDGVNKGAVFTIVFE